MDAINRNNDIPNDPTGFMKTRQTKNSLGVTDHSIDGKCRSSIYVN